MKSAVTRFAPSPTGHLHLGHAYSANIAWQSGEICPLRIEDIDPTRCKPEFETALYEDLAWLGFTWPSPVRRQSDHMNDYRICLEKLDAMGVLYPCFCTRKEIQDEIHESPGAPQSPNEHYYPGTCKKLSNSERLNLIAAGRPYALRLDSDRAYRMTAPLSWHDHYKGEQSIYPEIIGDVVLARKETPTSYHLCVTHDDALQGVTLVTRGEDLFHATHIHRLLQALLGLPTPLYAHHKLLTDERGIRLAKRNKSISIREMRNKGFSAAQLMSMIAS